MSVKGNKNASKFDISIVEEICLLVEDGQNIKTALKSNNKYPSFNTWCRWKRENDFVRDLYVNAIQDKSESVIEEIDEISKELRNGKLEPSVANVLIQTLKWKAAKFYPKMFGDNKQIDLNVDDKRLTPEERAKEIEQLKQMLNESE